MSSSIKVSEYPWDGPWSCDKGLMSKQKTGTETCTSAIWKCQSVVAVWEELWTSAKIWLNPHSSQFDASVSHIIYHHAEERTRACKSFLCRIRRKFRAKAQRHRSELFRPSPNFRECDVNDSKLSFGHSEENVHPSSLLSETFRKALMVHIEP